MAERQPGVARCDGVTAAAKPFLKVDTQGHDMATLKSAGSHGHRGPINSVTVMVCTYRRPEALPRFLESAAKLDIPAGITFHLCVADNNPESHYDRYIGAALAKLPFTHSYGHEPKPGYSNARNCALTLALKTKADMLAFSDDDMELDPDWLAGHLRTHNEFDCDVAGGAIQRRGGKHALGRRFKHGQICDKQGAGNVSFRRWIVDAQGLALRFDPRLNKTGREDQAFFGEAHDEGAKIVFSKYPVIYDTSMSGDDWQEELMNKAEVSAIMLRNDIVRMREERGFGPALASALWSTRFAVKALLSQAGAAASSVLGQERRADEKRISAHKSARKFSEAFKGLNGDYVSRSDARRK